MKKSGLIFLAIMLSLGFVFACDDSQVILRLSSDTNAHGAISTQTAYPIQICYDKIFGQTYTASTIPHDCNGGTRILSLSSDINAHAGIIGGYSTDVCYKGLTCSKKDACNEANGERLIVSLSSDTNAHISNSSDYPVKICCKIGTSISGAHWESMNGTINITTANKGDSVKLVVGGNNLGDVNYTIKKGVAFWFDKTIASQGTNGELIWLAGRDKNDNFATGTYYFTARLSDGTIMDSTPLTVGEENNAEINVAVFKPLDRQIYFLNEVLNFTMLASDEDDVLNYSWNLGDGTMKSGNSLTWANSSFEYAYTTPGQKNIFLNVWNKRGENITERVALLIADSAETLAYINKPEFQGDYFQEIVLINGSGSYAINYNKQAGTINCVMGNCPSHTEGCPVGSTLSKPACQITGISPPQGYSNANFTWIFDDYLRTNRTGSGLSNVIFNRTFTAGTHTIELFVDLTSRGVINTEFNVFYDIPTCSRGEDYSYWYLPSGDIEDSFENCYNSQASPSHCCPDFYSCDQESRQCIPTDIYSCSNYSSETECINDWEGVAVSDVESRTEEGFCELVEYDENNCERATQNCRCAWNVSARKCYSKYDLKRTCNGEEPILLGDCTFESTQETDCSLGYRHIEWTSSWTGDYDNPDCQGGSEDVPCLSETLLGFFDNIGLIIAIILLIIAYWLIVHNKKHHSNSIRKKKKR